MADTIYIRDLTVRCLIGTNPEERIHKQDVIINLALACDLAPAGQSDDLGDTVNYKTLKQQIVRHVERSRYNLIERLADRVAAICLRPAGVRGVRVTIDKPGALRWARSVAVEIERHKS